MSTPPAPFHSSIYSCARVGLPAFRWSEADGGSSGNSSTVGEKRKEEAMSEGAEGKNTFFKDCVRSTLSYILITAGNAQTYKGGAQTSFLDRQCAILSSLDSFDAAPFTVQRLCELMLAVEKGGLVLHKFCTSVERLLSVTTTQSWRPWEGLREQREQRWRESKKRKVESERKSSYTLEEQKININAAGEDGMEQAAVEGNVDEVGSPSSDSSEGSDRSDRSDTSTGSSGGGREVLTRDKIALLNNLQGVGLLQGVGGKREKENDEDSIDSTRAEDSAESGSDCGSERSDE